MLTKWKFISRRQSPRPSTLRPMASRLRRSGYVAVWVGLNLRPDETGGFVTDGVEGPEKLKSDPCVVRDVRISLSPLKSVATMF